MVDNSMHATHPSQNSGSRQVSTFIVFVAREGARMMGGGLLHGTDHTVLTHRVIRTEAA
jgi:hypothetical protein